MKSSELGLLSAIVRGVFVGATIGIITKFVTDKQNIKYAGTGAIIGAIAFGGIFLIKSN